MLLTRARAIMVPPEKARKALAAMLSGSVVSHLPQIGGTTPIKPPNSMMNSAAIRRLRVLVPIGV